QNQRALCAQTTKIDRLDAGATFDHETTELAVDLRGARSGGCRLHETGHIEETGRFVRLDRDDLHRRRRLIFWAFQQRSRNGYCLQCLWFFFLLLLLRRSIRLRSCGLILRLLGRRIVWLCICRASHEKAGADGGSQKLAIHQEYSPWCCDLLVDTHLHVSTKDGRKFRGTQNAQFPDSENAMSLTPRSHYPQINIFATFAKDFGKGMYCVKLRADPSPCQARRDASRLRPGARSRSKRPARRLSSHGAPQYHGSSGLYLRAAFMQQGANQHGAGRFTTRNSPHAKACCCVVACCAPAAGRLRRVQ